MMSKEAMKLALEALERIKRYGNTFGYRSHEQNPYEQVCEAITALREALAEQPAQQQEPVACSICNGSGHVAFDDLTRRNKNDNKWGRCLHCQPYTSPQPAQRKPLTDKEIDAEFDAFASKFDHESSEWLDMGVDAYFRAGFKAAHGIKENT